MALAWKAGWVNSPQGFESPILRHLLLVHCMHRIWIVLDALISPTVACPSGQRSAPRKRVWGQPHRGFKSHRHRHCSRGTPQGCPLNNYGDARDETYEDGAALISCAANSSSSAKLFSRAIL